LAGKRGFTNGFSGERVSSADLDEAVSPVLRVACPFNEEPIFRDKRDTAMHVVADDVSRR
jgi:hypothetical protein